MDLSSVMVKSSLSSGSLTSKSITDNNDKTDIQGKYQICVDDESQVLGKSIIIPSSSKNNSGLDIRKINKPKISSLQIPKNDQSGFSDDEDEKE